MSGRRVLWWGWGALSLMVGPDSGNLWAQVVEQWVVRYNGPGNGDDRATGLAVDELGNVYVTGYSTRSGRDHDIATVKYDPQGHELWVARYDGPGDVYYGPAALALDGAGDIYVTGSSDGAIATIRYDTEGNELWVARYDSAYAVDLAISASGNLSVVGTVFSGPAAPAQDIITITYDRDGRDLWRARYNGPAGFGDAPSGLALDENGNVYVAGICEVDPLARTAFVTLKYDAAGQLLWAIQYRGRWGLEGGARGLAVDGSGNVYVSGWSESTDESKYTTIKYGPDGGRLWEALYSAGWQGAAVASAVEVDSAGHAYVTGDITTYGGASLFATVKYTPLGQMLWDALYDGPGNDADIPMALTLDTEGNVYVTGLSAGESTAEDYATIKYDPEGNELWVARYSGPVADGYDAPHGVAVDRSWNVYVTGQSYGGRTSFDYATIKYRQGPVGIEDPGAAMPPIPQAFDLLPNSPNPFNPSTEIAYTIPAGAEGEVDVRLEIFTVRGERVRTLVNSRRGPGSYSVGWAGRDDFGRPVPSGVYFYRLSAEGFTSARKMTLLK